MRTRRSFPSSSKETFPTKATRFVKELIEGKIINSKYRQDGEILYGKMCYNYTFYGRCNKWQNCDFIQYRCKCGTDGCTCQFAKCKYAHRTFDLVFPPEFIMSAYPNCKETIELNFFNKDSQQDERFTILKEHIASTPMSYLCTLCPHPWCNDAQCPFGVHLCQTAWLHDEAAFKEGSHPVVPDYFRKKYGRAVVKTSSRTAWGPKAKAMPFLILEVPLAEEMPLAAAADEEVPLAEAAGEG
ncbi:unnamed protein product, partial [Polarella glacialis]